MEPKTTQRQQGETLNQLLGRTGLTADQLQAANPGVTATRTGGTYNLPTQTPPTSAPETGAPTVAQAYGTTDIIPNINTEYDKQRSIYGDFYRGQAEQQIDENAIRNNSLNAFQAQIDATNAIYAQRLAQAQQQGQGRLGSTAAIQGRRGLLGSDFGAAQTQNVISGNTQQEDLVREEQNAAIAEIMGKVREGATAEIAAKREAKQAGLDNYLSYLASGEERRASKVSNVIASLIAQGIDPTNLSQADVTALKNSGISIQDIKSGYAAEKKKADAEAAKAAQDAQFNLSEGEARYDAQGNVIAQRAKTYAPKTGENGLDGLISRLGSKAVSFGTAQANTFGSSDIVKTYNRLGAAANIINNIDPKSKNSAEHQSLISTYAKALDPDSVVRENEYETVKKYSQPLIKKYGGEIKHALSGKGFLSPQAIKAIQDATNQRIQAYAPQYENLKSQTANRINAVVGAPVADVFLLDYESGITPPKSSTVRVSGPQGTFDIPVDQLQTFTQQGYKQL